MKLTNSDLLKQHCFVNGEWVNAENNATLEVRNPFNDSIIGNVPNCGNATTKLAIDAAFQAWQKWRAVAANDRARIMMKWAQLIDRNKHDLAVIMTTEQGKPLSEAMSEIEYANAFLRFYAGCANHIDGDLLPAPIANDRILVMKQSVGVVGMITPWNFPAAMITRKAAPALAAGCTVVIKPAEDTPYSALALAQLANEAGIPKGVINIITGDASEIGKALCDSTLVRKISFTGSSQVGKILYKQSADTVKKISLELGGNAPFIVFDDADLEKAVEGCLASKFRNMGQTCICANRIYVHQKIFESFSQKLINAASNLKLGNGLDEGVNQGPLINKSGFDKVCRLVDDAIHKGAKVLLGGKPAEAGNLFFEPTVITKLTPDMDIFKNEIFGPVAALYPFEHENDVISAANNTPYGLASYFYTENLNRMWRVSEALEYGIVGVNSGSVSSAVGPFGGFKESGLGREGSMYGLDEYLEIKEVYIKGG